MRRILKNIILKNLPAYSETAPKTNIMQERSQMPMEVIPEKVKLSHFNWISLQCCKRLYMSTSFSDLYMYNYTKKDIFNVGSNPFMFVNMKRALFKHTQPNIFIRAKNRGFPVQQTRQDTSLRSSLFWKLFDPCLD